MKNIIEKLFATEAQRHREKCHPELVEGRPTSKEIWIRQAHHDNFKCAVALGGSESLC